MSEGKIVEEGMLWLGYFLRVGRHIGLRVFLSSETSALPGLERHLENESLEGQLSGSDFYYLGFGGW